MKTNKRRGFTLVELLVVIAILAILATVSVVGYTSFIQRATVSNDENIAAQLNQFLEAYKVDHKGNYYGQEITEDNIWFITQEILEDSQYGELVPQSLEYDYHFYFDLIAGKYVVMKDSDVGISAAKKFYNFFAKAAITGTRPGNVFTDNGQYFLVDTSGSPLADAVNAFYTWDENNTDLDAMLTVLQSSGVAELDALAKDAIFVTKHGNKSDVASTNKYVFIHENAEYVSIPVNTVDPAENTTIFVPAGKKILSLGIKAGSTVTVQFNDSKWDSLKEFVDAGFVDSSVSVTLTRDPGNTADGMKDYIVVGKYVYVRSDYEENGEDATIVAELEISNKVVKFDITLDDSNAMNYPGENRGYIAFDKISASGVALNIINETGNDEGEPVSPAQYAWDLVDPNAPATIEGNVLKLKENYAFGTEYIEVKAYVTTDPSIEQTFKLYISAVKDVNVTVADQNLNNCVNGGNYSVNLRHDAVLGTTYGLTFAPQKINDVPNTVAVSNANVKVALTEGDAVTLASDTGIITTVKEGTAKLTVTVGPETNPYHVFTITINVEDVAKSLLLQVKNPIAYVGNGNEIKLSDLFNGAENLPEGDYNVVVFDTEISTGQYDYNNPFGNRVVIEGSDAETLPSLYLSNGYSTKGAQNSANFGMAVSSNLSTKIKFEGTTKVTKNLDGTVDYEQVVIAIFSNGKRVSPDLTVRVVEGENVTKYSDLVSNKKTNYVLLDNIQMEFNTGKSNDNYENVKYGQFEVAENMTLYGNFFTFSVEGGTYCGEFAFIELKDNATMRDLRVVGSVFPRVQVQGSRVFGVNAVSAHYNATIENCYIANTRAPLVVGDEERETKEHTVTVKNTVLFGGVYANVDVRGGTTLKFEGDVITVNQSYEAKTLTETGAIGETKKTVGTGITVWIEAKKETYVIDLSKCNLKQYNFMSQTDSASLGTVHMEKKGVSVVGDVEVDINLADVFSDVFGKSKYEKFYFTKDGVQYVNSGFVSVYVSALNYIEYGNKFEGFNGYTGYGAAQFDADVTVKTSNIGDWLGALANAKLYIYTHDNTYSPDTISKPNDTLFTDSHGAVAKYAATATTGYDFVGGNIIH